MTSTTLTPLAAWQKAWREGFLPLLSTKGLRGLLEALQRDDPRLLQGQTVDPPPLACNDNEPAESCCPVAWALLDGRMPYQVSVGDLEYAFARVSVDASYLLGEEAACRYLFNWIDETPRAEMRRQLIAEVKLALDDQPGLAPRPAA